MTLQLSTMKAVSMRPFLDFEAPLIIKSLMFPVLTIHHVKRDTQSATTVTQREVHTLKMKIQEIMKGVHYLEQC